MGVWCGGGCVHTPAIPPTLKLTYDEVNQLDSLNGHKTSLGISWGGVPRTTPDSQSRERNLPAAPDVTCGSEGSTEEHCCHLVEKTAISLVPHLCASIAAEH